MSLAAEKMKWVEQIEGPFEFTDLFARYTEIVGLRVTQLHRAEEQFFVYFNDGSYLVIHDGQQSCCEERYLTCDDDLSGYEGAQIMEINSDAGGPEPLREPYDSECHEVQFVAIRTTRGTITLCTHNRHNGYYGGFDLTIKRRR